MDAFTVRPERRIDAAGIDAINRAAFGADAEALLVAALRRAGQVIASLVAETDDGLVGHILFSTAWIEGPGPHQTIASLAPMAVLPAWQRQGVGSALVREGISACAAAGLPAVIVVGHPSYYPRFGFSAGRVVHLESPYAGEAFMGLDLVEGFLERARGRVKYPDAFATF